MLNRKTLMIPGPSEAHPEVLSVLSQPIMPHYGIEWGKIYEETCEKLKEIFNTKQSVIILPGPGSVAMELAVGNLLEPGDKALVAYNGWFSEIFRQIIQIYGAEPILVRVNPGEIVPAEQVKKKMEEEEVMAIFVVQNETATGVLQPIEEIGAIAKDFGALLAVDSISSFSATEIRTDDWNIDICVGYASKALGAINGVVPIMIGDKAWERAEKRKEAMRARFLNLNVWKKFITDWGSWGHPYPSSMSTPLVLGLRRAVDLALEEGLEKRYLRHQISGRAMREGVRALGLKVLPDEKVASDTVTVATTPEEVNVNRLRGILYDKYDIMIADTGAFTGVKGIRIGHMGVTASPMFIIPTLAALEATLSDLGVKVKAGSGIASAMNVYRAWGK
jgi:alanine-glyoxylate transaminase/serine-glyoxylate transaminase/serine-pyruvate transaminase